MENFDWTSFTIQIAIKVSMEQIYDAWTKRCEIEKWFLSEALFSDEQGNEIKETAQVTPNSTYNWRWFLYDDAEDGKILSANGVDHFSFTFAGDCIVEIDLQQEAEYTIVKLTQKNIPTDDYNKKYTRLGCHGGWSFYLVNLKSVYEGSLDLRNKDSRLKPMLNN